MILIFSTLFAGVADKLCNHTHDFGGTDSISIHKDLLLSSGYHLDSGLGYVNGEYVDWQKIKSPVTVAHSKICA